MLYMHTFMVAPLLDKCERVATLEFCLAKYIILLMSKGLWSTKIVQNPYLPRVQQIILVLNWEFLFLFDILGFVICGHTQYLKRVSDFFWILSDWFRQK